MHSLGTIIDNSISWASSKAKAIAKSIGDSFARSKSHNYRSTYEVYHIVAKKVKNAQAARDILDKVGIAYNSSHNLVSIKTGLHRRLHTTEYYALANSVIIIAYNAAGNSRVKQRSNVLCALHYTYIYSADERNCSVLIWRL